VFRLLVAALLVALVLVLAHGAWVVWQTVRSGAEPEEGTSRPHRRHPRQRLDLRRVPQSHDRL